MSRSSHDSTYGSWSKTKALLSLGSHDPEKTSVNMLKKHRKRPSILTDRNDATQTSGETRSGASAESPAKASRPSLNLRHSKRPAVFSSLRNSTRSKDDKDEPEPLSAASTTAPSLVFGDALTDVTTGSKVVLLHGEVQTSAGMFRKKKEYLVLTDNTLTRYKSQAKAAEVIGTISPALSRSNTIKHGQMPSYGSSADLQTVSDSSGDKTGRISLDQVVAVFTLDDGKPYFTIEVSYLDEDSGHASSVTLQFGNPQERDTWIQAIRAAVCEIRIRVGNPISNYNLENAARLIEREHDYDPNNCLIFKVVHRQPVSKSGGRSSSDDLSKVASTVGMLAIGVHKIHLIPLARPVSRNSSPQLTSPRQFSNSHGLMTISSIKVSGHDDSFEIIVRRPLQRPQILLLASSASYEIACRLYYAESFLRPDDGHRFYRFAVPPEVDEILPPAVSPSVEEHNCFERTLIAYCMSYGVSPTNVRYAIDYECEDAPRFTLLPAADARRPYHPLELLAVMRSLRYNETFSSYSFAGIALDSLHNLHDNHGREFVCSRTKAGTVIRLSYEELAQSCLLRQEVRALAVGNRKLRRIDFSGCITISTLPAKQLDDDANTTSPGCGIVEALLPLCRHQTTNVDWICLNGIELDDGDLDYLIGAAVDKRCHFRALELNRCGLTDRSLGLLLDALRAQDNTLEALQLAGNTARIEPSTFDSQLSVFGFIRKLDLSNVSRTSGPEPLLEADTFMIWRLSELRLSGTTLNSASVEALATYLAAPRSQSLHELYLDNTQLSGGDIALLLQTMCKDQTEVRQLHLDISANQLGRDVDLLTNALSASWTPSHLSLRAIEYRDESHFRKVINALTVNKSTIYLNMAQTSLPGDATFESCRVLSKLLASNDTLIELDLSGEDSRLASAMFGTGINEALVGLKSNKTLKTLRIERQRLGLQGANTLAEALRENKTLQELFCSENEIPLQGLTDLVNALIDNTTLIYLPSMDDGRELAFKSAEATMRAMHVDMPPARVTVSPKQTPAVAHSPLKRGIANVRKTAQRTAAAAHTPSFPALQSYARSVSNPLPPSPPQMTLSLPRSRQGSESQGISAPVSFTVQDIQTTHRLLNEQWDRQCFRLAKYLERNWCLLNNIAVPMEIEDEKFERPESAGSLAKMLEQVKMDTTPRVEKDVYFDAVEHGSLKSALRSETTFKSFLLDSATGSPEEPDDDNEKQLRVQPAQHAQSAEPRTPTQGRFP